MVKNFWHSLKKPFHKVEEGLHHASHDVDKELHKIGNTIKRHPLETAAIVGTAVLGGAAIVLTGGLAAPEVIGIEAAEGAALASSAATIEMTSVGASAAAVDVGIDAVAADAVATDLVADAAAPEIADTIGLSVEDEAGLAEQEAQSLPLEPDAPVEPVEPVEAPVEAPAEPVEPELDLDQTAQDLIDEGILDNLNESVESGNMEKFMNISKQLLAKGQAGAQVLAQVGAIATLPAGAVSMVQKAKEIQQEKTISGKVGKLADLVNHANQVQAQLSGKEIDLLGDLGATLEDVGGHISKVEKAGEVLNTLTKKEIAIDKNNNDQLKELVEENKADAEAQAHGQVVLDNELQKLESEEKKEEDISMRIATTLDRPVSLGDFLKDISSFNSSKAKVDYVVENYTTFITLPPQDIQQILGLLNSANVISVF